MMPSIGLRISMRSSASCLRATSVSAECQLVLAAFDCCAACGKLGFQFALFGLERLDDFALGEDPEAGLGYFLCGDASGAGCH